jgi:hypothetical protein
MTSCNYITTSRCDHCNSDLHYNFDDIQPIIDVSLKVIRKTNCDCSCQNCCNATRDIEQKFSFCSFFCFKQFADSRLEPRWERYLGENDDKA